MSITSWRSNARDYRETPAIRRWSTLWAIAHSDLLDQAVWPATIRLEQSNPTVAFEGKRLRGIRGPSGRCSGIELALTRRQPRDPCEQRATKAIMARSRGTQCQLIETEDNRSDVATSGV